jgi:Sigma-70 region 3
MPDDLPTAYAGWKADPTPSKLNAVVDVLHPQIDQHLARMGMHGDPLMRSKARLLAADAIKTWDPGQGGSLPTWTGHQLMQLHRFRRLSQQALDIPEGVQLDALKIEQQRRELAEKKNREPTQEELADATGFSMKRLRDVQTGMRPTPAASAFGDASPAMLYNDHTAEAMDAIYGTADTVDKQIMEGRMGYNGAPTVDTRTLLLRTKLTPPQLSRRAARLATTLQATLADLEKLY